MAMQTETQMETRTRGRRGGGALNLASYKYDEKMSLPARAAHCLDWAAEKFPKQYITYPLLLKSIQGFSRMPQMNSDAVIQLKNTMQRVKSILIEKYGRELDSQPGIGVRATVDDADMLTTTLPKRMRRLRSAKNAVIKTTDLIDPTQIPATAEYKPWKDWFNRSVKDVRRLLMSEDFEQKLLPPAPADSED